jgi:hypothetical protein
MTDENARITFEFSKKDLETVIDEATPLKVDGAALEYVTMNQLKDEDRFTEMGGCPVALRASIVRIAFFKLLGTGVLCAFTAASVGTSASYSCALCAAVNFVACTHYALIWAWRGNLLPDTLKAFASKVGVPGRDDGNDGRRLLISENAVDGLRHSDWTVSYPTTMASFTYFHILVRASGDARPHDARHVAPRRKRQPQRRTHLEQVFLRGAPARHHHPRHNPAFPSR